MVEVLKILLVTNIALLNFLGFCFFFFKEIMFGDTIQSSATSKKNNLFLNLLEMDLEMVF